MIELEVEASLPADYGPVEVGYRPLVDAGQYEVYAVKRTHLESALQNLEACGLCPNFVLPSALFYLGSLDTDSETADLLVVETQDDSREIAFRNRDGSLAVRALTGNSETALWSNLTESIRSMFSERPQGNGVITLDWVGEIPQTVSWPESLVVRSRSDEFSLPPDTERMQRPQDLPLRLAAQSILEGIASRASWPTLNLLPASHSAAWGQHRLYQQLGIGMLGFALAVVFVYAALRVSTSRYEAEIARLDAQIAQISTAGETVGERLDQLGAVANARKTRNDFGAVVAALHDASPAQGLSYSQVNLNDESRLQLRGQAESLAMPFELPEQLELQPRFERVVLRDAGQAKKGVGSITEFRVEADFSRGIEVYSGGHKTGGGK